MPNLENLVAKILSDGEKREAEILDAARGQADAIYAEREAEASIETDRLLRRARSEAERARDRIVAERRLESRDAVLAAKGRALDAVFGEALARLNGMSKQAFTEYLKGSLAAADTDGEALLLPEKYGIGDLSELNAYLKSLGQKGNLVLSDDRSRAISGGFILSKDGIEQNNTFEAMVAFHRYRLEASISAELF